ncbi:MAG: hypothetical protein ACTSYL_03435 [Candidatus Thorarchaeota archaeon]
MDDLKTLVDYVKAGIRFSVLISFLLFLVPLDNVTILKMARHVHYFSLSWLSSK